MTQKPLIIIGTGLAGYNVAKEFRKLNSDMPMTIITADAGHFYSKPMLSSSLTTGKTPHTLAIADQEAMASQLNAEIHTNLRVEKIDTDNQVVFTKKGEFSFDQLVIACGAQVIKPPLEGSGANDVFHVNNLEDYARFREKIQDKKTIALLGCGLVGCEFANDLTNANFEVHCIAPAKAPLDLLIPEKIGHLLKDALTENGVHWHLEQVIETLDKVDQGYQATLSSGEVLQVDAVLSAIGIRPHVSFANESGLSVNKGIMVDRYLQTSAKNIYALGDCAEVEGLVLPFVAPLLLCARALAKTLAGDKTAVNYPAMPVVVKTPAHPIVISPPPKNVEGEWTVSVEDHNVRAKFYDKNNQLRGFVLTNAAVRERAALAKELPAWL